MTSVIEDTFYLYKNKFSSYNVKLTLDYLSYSPNNIQSRGVKESTRDIIGCILMKLRNDENRPEVYITIYSYPLIGKRRKRKKVTFEVANGISFEDNFNIANQWRSLLYYAIYTIKEKESCIPLYKYRKKVLIFINPKSGPGKALEMFEKTLKPLLSEAEVEHDSVITDHANHVYDLVQNKDFTPYAGIIIVSGDGLIYEVYNGLLQRNDCDSAVSIPIGVIPGGSGNGMASSISHTINEPYLSNPALVSSLNVANPVVSPLDLVLLQTQRGQKLLSFLSLGFGILADVDIESERLRAIGEARFTIYSLARVFRLRKYRALLSYKVSPRIAEKGFAPLLSPCLLQRSQTVGEIAGDDSERWGSLPQRSNSVSGDDEQDPLSPSAESLHRTFSDELTGIEVDRGKGCGNSRALETNYQLTNSPIKDWNPDLSEPVPEDWVTIEDEFVSIYAVNQPYINSRGLFSPKSTLNDGVLWLCFMRGNVSKKNLLKFLISIDEGTHVEVPGVSYVPVTDLRLVPLSPSGKITVDGELVDLEPLQATVLPGKGRVMVRRP